MTEKEMKRATFEGTQEANGKKIKYLDLGDIMEILENGKLGEINLETYEFYRGEIDLQRKKIADMEQGKKQAEVNEYLQTVEEDKENVLKYALKQNNNLPWQLRRQEADIKQEIKMIVGEPFVGSFDHRKKLAKYLGCEYNETTGRVDYSNEKRVVEERLIQQDFEKRQAEKKEAAAKGVNPEGFTPGIVE